MWQAAKTRQMKRLSSLTAAELPAWGQKGTESQSSKTLRLKICRYDSIILSTNFAA